MEKRVQVRPCKWGRQVVGACRWWGGRQVSSHLPLPLPPPRQRQRAKRKASRAMNVCKNTAKQMPNAKCAQTVKRPDGKGKAHASAQKQTMIF